MEESKDIEPAKADIVASEKQQDHVENLKSIAIDENSSSPVYSPYLRSYNIIWNQSYLQIAFD